MHLAARLNLSPRTADNMIADIFWKPDVHETEHNRAGLRDWARVNGYGASRSS